jgi:tRNA A-37 threonylcarbamoyl transferase component Bud32
MGRADPEAQLGGGSLSANVPGFEQAIQPPGVGRVLAGRYRLVAPIARGGMAEVWEGYDEVLSRPVAVKVLQAHLAADGVFLERFRREAVTAARLAHPGIVATFDTGLDEGTAFIVMELVRGRNLRQWLDGYGRLEPWQAVAVGRQVADALAYAHQAGLVHRDVKPANILLVEDEWGGLRAKVTDFGIAKAGMEAGADLTRTGMVLGTPKYLSPEQIRGADPDARADLYSLGVVLYEMLVGAPPYVGETDMATALAHLGDRVPKPSATVRGIPGGLDRVVCDLLVKSPDRRIPSALELRRRLDALGPLTPNGTGRGPNRHPRRRDRPPPGGAASYQAPYSYSGSGAAGPVPPAPAGGAAGGTVPGPGTREAVAGGSGAVAGAGVAAGQGAVAGAGVAAGQGAARAGAAGAGPAGSGSGGSGSGGSGPGAGAIDAAPAGGGAGGTGSGAGAPTTALPGGFAGAPPPPPPPGRVPGGAPAGAGIGAGAGTGAGAAIAAGAGATQVFSPPPLERGTDQFDSFPAAQGRSRHRIERNIGLVVLVLVVVGAIVAASLLLTGGGHRSARSGASTTTPSSSSHQIQSASVYLAVGGHSLDNASQTALAFDGNPTTSWSTDHYRSPTFGNLYSGIGLAIELSDSTTLHSLTVTSATAGWSASTYVSTTPIPTGQPVSAWGTATDSKTSIEGNAAFDLGGHKGRYVLLWITNLGPSLYAQIAELSVR